MANLYGVSSSAAVLRPMVLYPALTDRREPLRIIEVSDLRRASVWVDPFIAALQRLAALSYDWDGRGSRPVNFDDVRAALNFLQRVMRDDTRAPSVTPLSSGGIELSWRADALEVEAIFDQRRGETALLVTAGSNEAEEPIDAAEKLFADLVDRLATDWLSG